MNCDRFVGTGLVEVVKPIPRLRRTSSADGSYLAYRSRHKLVPRNKKQLSLNMNENLEPSMNPNPLDNTEVVISDFRRKGGNMDGLQLDETEVLFQTPSYFDGCFYSIHFSYMKFQAIQYMYSIVGI